MKKTMKDSLKEELAKAQAVRTKRTQQASARAWRKEMAAAAERAAAAAGATENDRTAAAERAAAAAGATENDRAAAAERAAAAATSVSTPENDRTLAAVAK